MTWTCSSCGTANHEHHDRCRTCSDPREETSAEEEISSSTWECDNCGSLTHAMYGQCSSCGAYRSSSDDTDDSEPALRGTNAACILCGRDLDEEPHEDGCPNDPNLYLNTDNSGGLALPTLQRGPDPNEADRIAVDFDNTLIEANVAYWDGERPDPDEAMIEWVNERYNEGKTIIVWTTRQWSQAGQIAAHCTEWGLKYHGIRCSKGSAGAYIDDKAIHPQDVITDRDGGGSA